MKKGLYYALLDTVFHILVFIFFFVKFLIIKRHQTQFVTVYFQEGGRWLERKK